MSTIQPGRPGLQAVLHAAAELNAGHVHQQALELEQRSREGRFYVACLGQFKRGKSTLISALIGAPVLPAGILPITAVPTIVRYGEQLAIRVRISSGEWKEIPAPDLEEYVSEEKNPGNRKEVTAVEVFAKSELLSSGMCLVDTPGLGSIFESNAEATRAFVPHVDAAIVVIGADPPLSSEELSLVETVSQHVKDLIFVLNKADRVSEAERRQASDFARHALETRLRRSVGSILEISSAERLQGAGPVRDWPELIRRLHELAEKSGASLSQSAWRRGMVRLSRELLGFIEERRGALTRPIEESRARLQRLREHLGSAQSSLRDLSPLLNAEHQRMAVIFSQTRKGFLHRAIPAAKAELKRQIQCVSFHSGPKYRRELMRVAQSIARDTVLPWLTQEEAAARELYRKATERFVALTENYLLSLARDLQLAEGTALVLKVRDQQCLTNQSEFRFHEIIRIAQPVSPFGMLRDLAFGIARVRGPFLRDAEEFLEKLLVVNSSRVENDVKDRVLKSREQLERHIRSALQEVLHEAEAAMISAETLMKNGQASVDAEIQRMDKLEGSLELIPM